MKTGFDFKLKEELLINSNIKDRFVYHAESNDDGSTYQISWQGEMVEYSRSEVEHYINNNDWILIV